MVAKQLGTVCVFGKDNCSKCEAAKDKLKKLGVEYSTHLLEKAIEPHEGWRTDGTVDIMACYSDSGTMPVITVDKRAYTYPETMKLLKGQQTSDAAQRKEFAVA